MAIRSYEINSYLFSDLCRIGSFRESKLFIDLDKKNLLKQDLIKHNDCLMYNQLFKIEKIKARYSSLERVLIIVEFDKNYEMLKGISEGIVIPFSHDEAITFKRFTMSSSMIRNKKIYFINEEFYEEATKRITLDLKPQKVLLAKWFAYTGLASSEAVVLDKIKLGTDEIAIIDDLEIDRRVDCITAISKTLLLEQINSYIYATNKNFPLKKRLYKHYQLVFKSYIRALNDPLNEDLNEDIKLIIRKIEEIISFNSKRSTNIIYNEIKAIYEDNLDKMNIDELKAFLYALLLAIKASPIKYNRDYKIINNILSPGYQEIIVEDLEKLAKLECFEVLKNRRSLIAFKNSYLKSNLALEEIKNLSRDIDKVLYSKVTRNASKEFKKLKKEYFIEDSKKVKWYPIALKDYPKKINMFDGVGLISLELKNEINKYLGTNDINTFQIRMPFIKGMVHACDLKGFFKNHKIKVISGAKSLGNKLYDVDKIKMILTESQFKCLKLLSREFDSKNNSKNKILEYYFEKLEKYDYSLAISEYDNAKDSINLNYQFLSTLPLAKADLDYLIENAQKDFNSVDNFEYILDSLKYKDNYGSELARLYPNVYKTLRIYKDQRNKLLDSKKADLKLGHIPVNGAFKYLSSDLLNLLYHIIGRPFYLDDKNNRLADNEFYMPSLNKEAKAIFLRNPHYSRNEIAIAKNNLGNEERIKYFGHLKDVVMINPRSMLEERLGGADYDGDKITIITDERIVQGLEAKLEENNASRKLVIIPNLKPKKTFNPNDSNAILSYLRLAFNNMVGIISNRAFSESINDYYLNYSEKNAIKMASYTILNGLIIDSVKSGLEPDVSKIGINNPFLKAIAGKTLEANDEEKISNNLSFPLYYLFNAINNFLKPSSKSSFNYFKNLEAKIDDGELIALLPIILARKALNNSSDNSLLKTILDFLNKNIKKDYKELFEIDSFKPFDPINIYNNYFKEAIPYHYLKSKEDKLKYLEKIGLSSLSEAEREILLDYDNRGYMNLYLILRYHSLVEAEKNKQVEWYNENKNYEIKDLVRKNKTQINLLEKLSQAEINLIAKRKIEIYNEALKLDASKQYAYFKRLLKPFSLQNLKAVISDNDLRESSLTYLFFEDKAIGYLKEDNDGKDRL